MTTTQIAEQLTLFATDPVYNCKTCDGYIACRCTQCPYCREVFKAAYLRRQKESKARSIIKTVVDDKYALVVMATKKSGFGGVLFATTIEGAQAFCGLDKTSGTSSYGGKWAFFYITHDLDECEIFVNDDGRFDEPIQQNNIPVLFRVAKKGGGKTEVKKWREKANLCQNQSI